MLLHAHRRRGETIQVEFEGKRYDFAPNEAGDVVCEVADKAHAKHLIENTDGYIEYGKDPAVKLPVKVAASTTTVDTNVATTSTDGPFVLRNAANERIDLADMTDADLRKFGKAQGVKVA